MDYWANGDAKLLAGGVEPGKTAFAQTPAADTELAEQEYFDKGILMVAMVKAGVELAFEAMVEAGIEPESAYYESLHETPLIANTIARNKLYGMNQIISDTAEYGCYLFAHAAEPMLKEFMVQVGTDVIGKGLELTDCAVDNKTLVEVNAEIRYHDVEVVGEELRAAMSGMKSL
jgi:ketol-acid reductoisomerase